jgi:hypothetical protein
VHLASQATSSSPPPTEPARRKANPNNQHPRQAPKAASQPRQPPLARRQALAAGYRSNSQNFTNTVTALLTKMDGVEHITGQGYRLKKKV